MIEEGVEFVAVDVTVAAKNGLDALFDEDADVVDDDGDMDVFVLKAFVLVVISFLVEFVICVVVDAVDDVGELRLFTLEVELTGEKEEDVELLLLVL